MMETRYIYNMTLANWLIRHGVMPCGAGVGAKGDTFVQFKQCKRFQEEMNKWKDYFKDKK